MRKLVLQGLFFIASFVVTLWVLRQVDWIKLFHIDRATSQTEQKLGDMFWELYSRTEKECTDSIVVSSVDSLVERICNRNGMEKSKIKVHLLVKDEVNAFALPDGYLVIYTGLISGCKSQYELAGVIGHEIAHIELNHVMKKLVKEFGLSALISITTGHGGSGTIQETAKMLSSTAFDRNLEREADMKAVEYLLNAHINPRPFADFLGSMDEEGNEIKALSWISTHPDSNERAEDILKALEHRMIHDSPVLMQATWERVLEELNK
jgi:predicted Zn-dependent protease